MIRDFIANQSFSMLLSRPTSNPSVWVWALSIACSPAPVCTWTKNSHPDIQQIMFSFFFLFHLRGQRGDKTTNHQFCKTHPESDHFLPLLCYHCPSHHHRFLAWLNIFRISPTRRSSAVQHFSNCHLWGFYHPNLHATHQGSSTPSSIVQTLIPDCLPLWPSASPRTALCIHAGVRDKGPDSRATLPKFKS